MIAWIKAYFLRTFKRPAIIVTMLILVLVSAVMALLSKSEMSGFACGIKQSEDENIIKIITALEEENTILDVVLYEDEDEMIKALRRGDIRFAYIFDDEFSAKYEEEKTNKTIIRFSKKDDIFAALADELIFAKTVDVFATVSLKSFINNSDKIPEEYKEETYKKSLVKYDKYMETLGGVFVYEAQNGQITTQEGGSATFPVRGMGAVLVLIAALFGAQTMLQDEQRFLLARLSVTKKNIVRLISSMMPALILAIILFFCLVVCGVSQSIIYEVILTLLFALSCGAFAFFVSSFMKNPDAIAMLIPFMSLLILVICPVFFDITAIITPLKYIAILLPPYSYLHASTGSFIFAFTQTAIIILYIAGGVFVRITRRK